ncbi:MAG: LytS/YhcK type 5TM receptor domain-containing protein [Bacteroidales bacterium]
MIIVELIFNLALLVSVSVLSGFIDSHWKRTTRHGVVLQGMLFGLVALLGMLNPFVLAPGIFFDGRSVVLSLCGLFFGPVAGIIAAVFAFSYRLYVGGSGVYMGLSVIVSSTLIGIAFHYYQRTTRLLSNLFYLYGIGLIVHLVMVALILAIPAPLRLMTFKTLVFSILGVYPLATVLIGKILMDQAASSGRHVAEMALRESENKFTLFMDHLRAFAFIKDSESRAIFVNKNMNEVLGASAWLGLKPDDFFPGEFGEQMIREDLKVLDEGFLIIEEQVPGVTGEVRCYETQKFIIPREGQDPLLGGIAIDITDRKLAEEALKQKALELERFNTLMIGRELKMIDLKKEINSLCLILGKEEKYIIHEKNGS